VFTLIVLSVALAGTAHATAETARHVPPTAVPPTAVPPAAVQPAQPAPLDAAPAGVGIARPLFALAAGTGEKASAKTDGGAAKDGPLIDINTATEEELASLPGIGEARSRSIVKGRPYARKDELVRRKIIPQSVYDQIRDRIIAKQH